MKTYKQWDVHGQVLEFILLIVLRDPDGNGAWDERIDARPGFLLLGRR